MTPAAHVFTFEVTQDELEQLTLCVNMILDHIDSGIFKDDPTIDNLDYMLLHGLAAQFEAAEPDVDGVDDPDTRNPADDPLPKENVTSHVPDST